MTVYPFANRKKALQRNEPIELYGLTFYPILVENYEAFQAHKPALLLRQGTLPAVYAAQNFLSAIWGIEIDSIEKSGNGTGLFGSLMMTLVLALRLESIMEIQILRDKTDPDKLSAILVPNGDLIVKITPKDFTSVRLLIAEQNGETLPDEADNPELIEARNDVLFNSANSLAYDFQTLIASVASARMIRQSELLSWPIKEFTQEVNAISRRIGNIVCAIQESNGYKWKSGNPYPSWAYNRVESDLAGLISMNQFQKEHGNIEVRSEPPTI